MLLAVLSGFIASGIWAITGNHLKGKVEYLASLVPVGLFVYFLNLLPGVASSSGYTEVFEWVPSLGVNLSFRIDGLGLLFSLLITGIGSMVFLYTAGYMKGSENLHKFYAYLSLFMGAMLGLVLSDNLISLFVFWELTSISSFFLIGYNNKSVASQRAALIALGITGFGGLFLLAGALLMGSAGGTYSIQELLSGGIDFTQQDAYPLLLVFFLMAAFTKSAQFPFHFWLPAAMEAPTPASTYLHSATMVKAGVYLLLRLSPLLSGSDAWHYTLMAFGGFTMLYAAFHSLFRTDLKRILAYSTISALGIMVFLIGVGTKDAMLSVALFILVHGLYKAGLFLVTGNVDAATGTRDISKLQGLGRVLFPIALAGTLAALSNGGIPPSIGFISKDLLYETALNAPYVPIILLAALIITKIFLLAAGMWVGVRPFLGKKTEELGDTELPGPLMWMPPLLLGLLGLIFGIAPGLIENILIFPVVSALGIDTSGMHLKIWHGFNLVLGLSAITILSGFLLFYFYQPSTQAQTFINNYAKLAPEKILMTLTRRLNSYFYKLTVFFQSGYLRRYVRVVIVFLTVLLGTQIFRNLNFTPRYETLLDLTFYEIAIVIIMVLAIIFTVNTHSRLGAVAGLGVIGYSICLLFVFYSAPDLAMTQFTIDTLTVILFVLILYRLPVYISKSSKMQHTRDWLLSLLFGAIISIIALSALDATSSKEVSAYYASEAYDKAKGKNIVNVILVDFRGMDTMVEITVLVIAALGVFGLLKLRFKDKES